MTTGRQEMLKNARTAKASRSQEDSKMNKEQQQRIMKEGTTTKEMHS